MGLWSWLTGVDLDEQQRLGEQRDAALGELNQQALSRGHWTEGQFNESEMNRASGMTGDLSGEVGAAFVEGAKEGLASMTSGVNATLSGAVWAILKSIPLSVWVIGLVVLFLLAFRNDYSHDCLPGLAGKRARISAACSCVIAYI